MINQTILHYKIIEKLGEGGMGVVYKALDTKLKREVAIKFLPLHITANVEVRKRFENEAQAAALLNHPNIATVYSIEEIQNTLSEKQTFIVMEYVEGKNIKQIIETHDHESLKMNDIISYAIQIAEGLETAHKKGIIHRDIKSSNIMVTSTGKIKIMDFGLAKFPGRTELTKGDKKMGTVAYMSPEQSKGDSANFQTDIWSFGVVLYELVTGQLPFQSDYEQAVIYNIMNENPQSVKMLNKKVPDKLANIIHRVLEKEPKKRFSSVSELLEDLFFLRSDQEPASVVTRNFKTLLRKPRYFIPGLILLLLIAFIVIGWLNNQANVDWARNEALPEIERLTENINIFGEGSEPWTAFTLATKAVEYIPDNHLLARLWPRFSKYVNVYSQPAKASVYARPYSDTTAAWTYLGLTPIDSIRLPVGLSRIKLERKGYRTVLDLINNTVFSGDNHKYALPKLQSLSDDMVFVQGGNIMVGLPALSHVKAENVNNFLMDKYEVTNKAYKVFVDSNGYNKHEYWKYPFIEDGKQISWKEAMTRFTDKTGRPGPSTWEFSNYPNSEDEYPVTGISWYEAAAFAKFTGKKLPTVYHWNIVAFLSAVSGIIPLSNINAEGPIQVNNSKAMNRFGVYDLAGNVREWCLNSDGNNRRFILGGGWDDPGWAFNDALALSPFDRSKTNGIRCIRYIKSNENQSLLENSLNLTFRNYSREKPVSDETFQFYLNQFSYDKTQLQAAIEYRKEENNWIREKINFNAAYGNERMTAYLFLPKNIEPPYQTVIYFPGSTAIHMHSSETSLEFLVKFLPRDGRAVMYPVYKGTYERGDDLKSDYQDETNFYKEHVIMWVKDLERSIDYLETRDDIDTRKLAYYGSSWGGTIAPIPLAVEKRIKVAVLRGAGLAFESVLAEVDPFNYLPRVKIPVLMLNGRYDFFLPVESSQTPFFEWLGTPEKDKIIRRYETGHGVPRVERIKETVTWLDHYLGSVR